VSGDRDGRSEVANTEDVPVRRCVSVQEAASLSKLSASRSEEEVEPRRT
jgi:hypothetical protein